MTSSRDLQAKLQKTVWNGSIPLEIRLANADCRTYDESDPYLIQFPRLSYLALLIPGLRSFFSSFLIHPDVSPDETWLSYQGVPLKWQYPLGLLYDLYSGSEPAYPKGEAEEKDEPSQPWKLTIHFTDLPLEHLIRLDVEGKHLHDLFINNVKEADFLRNGTGKTVMSLSKEDSTQLWESVKQHKFSLFSPINQKLLSPQGTSLRHLPIRLYLPSKPRDDKSNRSIRVVQGLVPLTLSSSRQTQTVGTALNQVLKPLFPSTRTALEAQPILHGAVLPLSTSLEDLVRVTPYLDGWLHIAIKMRHMG
ncbi:autophagy protein-like protein 5 [Zopfia rhizophila CBS 207.26]|uniref:Autophagy protein 5 n=1 Tax=Zopfia rhizophila CBS 207.26 TaxID=1314779 RepID=A0A6A6DLS8_9PEZI|nr:autophagy protein-like protein 5 [Zopfia rhizophila CBS 207.26]